MTSPSFFNFILINYNSELYFLPDQPGFEPLAHSVACAAFAACVAFTEELSESYPVKLASCRLMFREVTEASSGSRR